MKLCSPFLWCSVAFSKICPAGIGYILEDRREIFAFPPIIYPRKLDKDGESLNAETCKLLCKSHFLTVISALFLSEIKRPVRHYSIFPPLTSFFLFCCSWNVIISFKQPPETTTAVQQAPTTTTSSPRVPGKLLFGGQISEKALW